MAPPTDTPLILDTHSWLWLMDGTQHVSGSVFVQEAEAASDSGQLFVCSVSLAEVALLAGTGRLRLVVPVATWLEEAMSTPGLQVVSIDASLASEGAALPGNFEGDAADRLIVAAARLMRGRLATADPLLLRYADQGHVRALEIPGG